MRSAWKHVARKKGSEPGTNQSGPCAVPRLICDAGPCLALRSSLRPSHVGNASPRVSAFAHDLLFMTFLYLAGPAPSLSFSLSLGPSVHQRRCRAVSFPRWRDVATRRCMRRASLNTRTHSYASAIGGDYLSRSLTPRGSIQWNSVLRTASPTAPDTSSGNNVTTDDPLPAAANAAALDPVNVAKPPFQAGTPRRGRAFGGITVRFSSAPLTSFFCLWMSANTGSTSPFGHGRCCSRLRHVPGLRKSSASPYFP